MSKALEAKIDSLLAIVSTQEARIAELSAKVAAQPTRKPSTHKIVVTEGIPSKSGNAWGTVEITDTTTGVTMKLFLDKRHAAGKRKDGADQTVLYASVMTDSEKGTSSSDTVAVAASSDTADIKF